ncbi:UNVERIFIED_CONTAM: cytochrome [Sesamum radiatum]|uniref:Cytochrome n=1 Tax=Sesamum radiatum TaxID=300843 RepID=A0AAW2L2G3_SESRA
MLFSTLAVLVLAFFFLHLYVSVIVKPARIRRILRQQAIDGPPPKILLGNTLDVKKSRDAAEKAALNHPHPPLIHNSAAVLPFAEEWRQQYGRLYVFSIGKMQILYVNDPELVKEITTCTSLDSGKPSYQQKVFRPLLGKGILSSNGSVWARQRKIIAPELFMDKARYICIYSWKHKVESEGGGVVEIGVGHCMKRFSGDIISRACFGGSYSKGQEIFLKFVDLQEIMYKWKLSALGIPGLRHLPTKTNRKIWALEKEISALILKVVKERREAGHERDLLQTLLEVAKTSYSTSAAIDQFIVDNCRNIYLAGFETSAVSASWCLMLLASNPEWQTRLRDEVEEVCQGRIPDIDMLRKMKKLHMVIQETMRLYPPAPTLAREAFKDVKIGNIRVPKGVNVWTMVTALHTDTALWGADALEFKPQRFENGIAGACKSPNAYIPFGFGQRVCVGQHLAMVELKMLMALILTNFSFTLSLNYVHSPVMKTIIEPKHGVQIMVKKL